MLRSLIAVVALAAAVVTVVGQAATTVLDGVYTHEQAERGEGVYSSSCIGCHEGQDADGPELMGKAFLDRWREDTLEPLYAFIRTTMPGNAPGSLDDRAYVDLMAFILEANGLPPGKGELTAALISTIQLVGPDGPRPLSNLTIVRAVGCLNAGANDTWTLVNASNPRPVRARIVNGTTPEELKVSAAQPLGSQSFPLTSVMPQSASSAGHKVQVKGVLTRQGALERINVMSIDSVGPTCAG